MSIEALLFLAVGGVGALLMRIVWDWLSNRKTEKSSICKDCKCFSRIVKTETCLAQLKVNQGRSDEKITHLTSHTVQTSETLVALTKDVGSIKESLAVLAALAEERNKSGKSLFQQG